MGGAVSTSGFTGYYGYAGTVMIFDRILKTAERNILLEYTSLWNRTDDSYYSVTGLFNRSYYWASYNGYPYMFFIQYLGGIGMEADGSVTTGTSAGLTVTNVSFLTNGAYLLAATETPSSLTKVPNTGTVLAADAALYIRGELPAGYTAASQRRWLIDRTGGSTGSVKMRFDLKNMGVSPKLGQTLGLLSSTLGGNPYTARASAVYDGSGAIEFTVPNPPDGIYTVGIGPDLPPPPNIVRTMTSVSLSDGVSSSNFFNLPGSVLRQTATFSNNGGSTPTANSVQVDVPIKPNTKLRLVDLGTVGSGPVLFSGSTAPPVGLSYTYSGLANTTDGLSFSNDNGTTYNYTPVPDPDLADANVTHFRVTLPGNFAFSATTPYPTFTLTYDVKIK